MSKFRVGTWSVICDVCGFRFQNTEVMKRWDGLIVCKADYETKHPQLTIRIQPERTVPDFVRPFGTDTYIEVCTEKTRQGIAGVGVVGCFTVGYVSRATF